MWILLKISEVEQHAINLAVASQVVLAKNDRGQQVVYVHLADRRLPIQVDDPEEIAQIIKLVPFKIAAPIKKGK